MLKLERFLQDLWGGAQTLSGKASLNWVDFVIFVFVLLYAAEGYAMGFLHASFDFLSFVLAFLIALKLYFLPAQLIRDTFSIPAGFSNAIGFFIVAFFAEVFLSIAFRKISRNFILPKVEGLEAFKRANNFLGIIPGVLSSFVLLSFILTLVIALPVSPVIKSAVSESRLGSTLISYTQGLDKDLKKVFGGAVSDTLNFLTIEPKSSETVNLKFKVTNFSVDEEAEREMLVLVNNERTSRGLSPIEPGGELLVKVARSHCGDMFVRGYFSHYTPEGLSPFDRMDRAGVTYEYAGENLALAPSTQTAMQGLMNSPGHRANILSENFGTLGVGVIDGGIYGKMFCQEFTD